MMDLHYFIIKKLIIMIEMDMLSYDIVEIILSYLDSINIANVIDSGIVVSYFNTKQGSTFLTNFFINAINEMTVIIANINK